MKFLVLMAVLFVSSGSTGFAADNPMNPQGFQGGGAQDLLGVTRVPTDISNQPSTVQFNLTCKDSEGYEYKEGQSGFNQCMEKSKANNQKRVQNGSNR